MALIKCSECGKEISDKSLKCVHCGVKILNEEQKLKLQVKKENSLERKLLTKIVFIVIGVLVLMPIIYLLIAFFFPIKNVNFIEKYNDYLNYALGSNWKVSKTNTYKTFQNLKFIEVTEWTIDYETSSNTQDSFMISNYSLAYYKDTKKASDYIFASEILYSYRSKLNEKMASGNISDLDNSINIIDLSEIDNNMFLKRLPEIIDSKTGLLFKDVKLDNLADDLYYLELGALYSSGSDIDAYTIKEAKKIIDYYNIKNAIISAGMVSDGQTTPIYCLKRGVEVSCPMETELGSMNNTIANISDYISLN